jgi:hypothetical protein
VRSYECTVVDSWVQADLVPRAPKRSLRDLLLAHARGEDPQ